MEMEDLKKKKKDLPVYPADHFRVVNENSNTRIKKKTR